MSPYTPEKFWSIYKEAIKNMPATLQKYQSNRLWTKLTLDAAEVAIETLSDGKLSLELSKEYFRIDVIASEKVGKFNWHMRVAFEHENNPKTWDQELCKLTQVIADLRVIVGYHQFNQTGLIGKDLQLKTDRLKGDGDACRICRRPNDKWLFIFGPMNPNYQLPFEAFTLDGTKVRQLPDGDDKPLIPGDWPKS